MTQSKRPLTCALALAALLVPLALSGNASAATEKTTSFSLASGTRALALTAGPDGNLWFAGIKYFSNNQIGRVTPSGQVTEFPLPAEEPQESGVPAIVTGSDSNLWFTEEATNKIGRITISGEITQFPLPTAGSRPSAIAAGPDGNLWFTEEAANKIGRISTAGAITEFSLSPGSGPAGIAAGPDGNLWFTEKAANKIGRITTSGEISEYPLPGDGEPSAITVGPDGNLWFTQGYAKALIGRITPAGEVTQFPIPTRAGTGAIAAGPAGDVWFAAGSEIGSISPSGRTTQPSCLGSACSLPVRSLAMGPEGNLWFGTGTRNTEGGGGSGILALQEPGTVGKFFPPPLAVAIGPNAGPVAGRRTDLRLSCEGAAAGSECKGVLRLTRRIPGSSSRSSGGARTLVLGLRRYELVSGESRRVALRLTHRALTLLERRHTLQTTATATVWGGKKAIRRPITLRQRRSHKRHNR